MTAILRSIATANPPHLLRQQDVERFAAHLFPKYAVSRRHMEIFRNARIDTRAVSKPLEWYGEDHSFPEKNAAACEMALQLSIETAEQAISQAGLHPEDIEALVFVNTTVVSAPSLDAKLIQAIGLPLRTQRIPVWGLGCAGGAAGLARAADLVNSGKKHVLLIAVEICSLTFIKEDHSKSNFVGAALFADGAAALVLSSSGEGIEILGGHSSLIPDSEDVMGWDVLESGLKVRFSRDIPTLLREVMPESLQNACEAHGLERKDLKHHVLHPGGVKVIEAYSEVTGVCMKHLDATLWVLRHFGNMSSPSVLFVLKKYLESPLRPGCGILTAMGPGFCAEHVLFRVP
ncbi:type III polyketide synthase [Deinococcus cellulosilyticus]|uniref:Chalcone synthase n=1 Tax=Deinococcus cellulosilyticus (strain DSM 18568 / NBRC 106333 / KACC 11606 / 5516J-15) TaxID=1223518 RepID=A0A511N0T6_DEIC1|nr:3-oxoacyl-[acyl-carrier-protein] synthase III C-terminal domain-containing protein [Deinococcus cellulosilyticus]GEM46490.1 chalcone synthase [Deinococcus cellulosilyticus NBRC 106333 = KACC 11606]